MADETPSALILHFAPRRTRPRVCVAIRGEMVIDGDIVVSLALIPANDLSEGLEGGQS